jgi:ATP/maltotriose-dependent transcriptional regulator MalT/DNA-binding SARP family transcriptional activator
MDIAKTLPPKPTVILDRERLINRLRSWEDKKLVLIHGQAGQGKSTLAAGYLRMVDGPALWYNMDQEDDNPEVFLSSLGEAVMRTWPRQVPKLPVIPQNRYGVGGKYQSVTHWISQVFSDLPDQSLIVFDDYNIPSPRTIPHLLKTLLESTPPQVRFMVISRMQPEIEVAKLRARRAVGEITGEDLKFRDDEAAALFKAVFGMRLAPKEVSFVNSTAEGWAAGLVLMHEYLATKDPRDRPSSFAGRRRTGFQAQVFDYLAQEVFSHLPADMQAFLLRTSVSEYLPAPLMAELLGLPAGANNAIGTMVGELLRKNLFITAANDDGTVVRFHALFREFLLRKLMDQTKPAEVKRLYTTAARYFKDAGDVVRTVDLYLASGQFDKAVEQIEASGQELLGRGRTQTLLRWIEGLPLDYADRPWFKLYRAVACRFSDPRRALVLFDEALGAFRADKSSREGIAGQMISLSGLVEASFYTGANFERMDVAAARATALLKRIGRGAPEAQARLLIAIGTACFFTGKLRRGAETLQESLDLFRKTGNHFFQIHSAIYLAPCALYLGDMRLAREAVRKGFEALEAIPEETGGEAALHMAQAMTALFEGNFEEAQEAIDRCHGLAQEYDLEAFDFLSLDIGGWLKTASGDFEHAERLLEECKRKAEEYGNAFFASSAAHLLALNSLHWNRPGRALAEAEYALAVRETMGSTLFHAVSLAALGAVHAKLGKTSQAEKSLSAALSIVRQIGAAQQEANILAVLARLAFKRNRNDDGLRLLSEAFGIGRERGFTYYAMLTAKGTADLAERALAAGIEAEYCRRLLGNARKACDASLRIFTLGGFLVHRGEQRIADGEWKSKRSKSLVKLLVAQAGQKVPRDVVIETLSQEPLSEASRLAFNGMLHRLRKMLDQTSADGDVGCIIHEGNLIGLNLSTVWTDVGQFLSHLETAGRMKSKNEAKKAVEEYEKAIALYRGDFLPEDLYEDWTVSVRDRLRTACLKAIEDAGALCEVLEDKGKAAGFYEQLFLSDPCNEKACRWLMTWHIANGRRAEAVRVYERCQRALHQELDVEPEGTTKALYRGIIEV